MIVGIFDGIIKKFNEKFPRQGVKQFDKITAVNGKRGSANEMRRRERGIRAFREWGGGKSSGGQQGDAGLLWLTQGESNEFSITLTAVRMMVSAIADETLDLLQLTIRRPTEIQTLGLPM